MPEQERPSEPASDSDGPQKSKLNPVYNAISGLGVVLAASGLTGILFYFLADVMSGRGGGYLGVSLLPPLGVALVGFALIPVGLWVENWHRGRGNTPSLARNLSLDLSGLLRPRFAILLLTGASLATLVVMSLGAGSIKLIQFTESNTFCGTMCHPVMTPEYTAYQDSPHAHITCVECHVGHGAESYIRAKLSGIRQIYALAVGNYSRPIPTPLHDQRPAREVCEQCHWPERFIDYKAITRHYYMSDEENTKTTTRLLIKIGGGQNGLIEGSGIHHHMLMTRKVEYIARDHERQDIPWVRVERPDGSVVEFNTTEEPLTEEERQNLEVRAMDCLDCHNRPAHQFTAPANAVNQAMNTGLISQDLPHIKVEAVRALDGGYQDSASAQQGIAERLTSFYQDSYPDVFKDSQPELQKAIEAIQMIYQRTIFPEMRADWSSHANNIGHRDSSGCFRCHNDEMQSADGQTIFTTCTKCHVILAQGGDGVRIETDFEHGQAFVHPEDDDTIEEFTNCTDCHTGGIDVYE